MSRVLRYNLRCRVCAIDTFWFIFQEQAYFDVPGPMKLVYEPSSSETEDMGERVSREPTDTTSSEEIEEIIDPMSTERTYPAIPEQSSSSTQSYIVVDDEEITTSKPTDFSTENFMRHDMKQKGSYPTSMLVCLWL